MIEQTTVRQNRQDLPDFYQRYFSELDALIVYEQSTINEALAATFALSYDVFAQIYPMTKDYKYAADKWSIAEVIGHLIDFERIYSTRALRLARRDEFNDVSFDYNAYVRQSHYTQRPWESIKQELLTVEESTGHLFEGLSDEALNYLGRTGNQLLSPQSIGYFIAAHRYHHFMLLINRYLND